MRLGCLILLAACGGGGGFPDAKEVDASPKGTFSAVWSVIDQDSQPISCDRIAGQTMTVLAHNKAFEGGSTQIFSCSSGMGTSQQMIAGVYDLDFELAGTFGLYARAGSQLGVAIPANTNTPLQPLVFQVQATGAMELSFATGKTGGNCGATNAGGAGIDGVTITMVHNSDANCAPITLTIAPGATQPGGSYTIDCNTPMTFGCIEADQTISASGVPSDGYTVHVTGKIGTKNCYINNDTIQVPPLDKTLVRTLNLALNTQVSGC